MQYLRADTSVKVVIGPVVAVGDGFTPVTGLSLTTADEAEIMKHDAAAVLDIGDGTWTFAAITNADGYYNLTIKSTDVDTEGLLSVIINDDSLCLPVKAEFMVMNAVAYDALYAAAGTDTLDVNVTTIEGADATDTINAQCDTAISDAALATAANLATVDTNVDAILVDTGTTLPATLTTIEGKVDTVDTVVDNILVDTGTTLDGKINTIDTNVDAILVDTGTTIPTTLTTIEGKVDTVDTVADAILVDTGTTLDGKINTIDTVVDGIQADLDNATDGLGALKALLDAIDTVVDAILVDTAEIGTAGAGLTDLGGMSTAMKAEVNAEALDVLATDTVSKPGQETPTDTPTRSYILELLYKHLTNKRTQTATQFSLYNDDAVTIDQKATFSDDGTTATTTELVTGP
jgi:hypothetical protein